MQNMILRFIGYISCLRQLFGLRAAFIFVAYYALARARGDQSGRLHYIPVGPYIFYFPLHEFFAGLFNEIFLKGGYYLEPTSAPIRVIDCGANIGVSLLYIKLMAPHAQVLCFEPNPSACNILKKNIEANKWQKEVFVKSCALGARSGVADLFFEPGIATDSSASLTKKPGKSGQQRGTSRVTVETLSPYLKERVDLLKIDIEGDEFDVLQEVATAGRLEQVACVQLEYHYEPGFFVRPLSDILKLLEAAGFQTAVQTTTTPALMMRNNWRRNHLVYAWRN